jgi:hypothetical protein
MKRNAYFFVLATVLISTACQSELKIENVKSENVVDECSCIENLAVSVQHFYGYYESHQATFKEFSERINAKEVIPAELAEKHNAMMQGMQENGKRVQQITAACEAFVDRGTLSSPQFQSDCPHTAAFKEAMAKINSLE